jgi:Tat protein secretion system quality control protein TatD with DNase activity
MARDRFEADASIITFKGRRFEPEEVRLIAEVVAGFPRLSRQELANTLDSAVRRG